MNNGVLIQAQKPPVMPLPLATSLAVVPVPLPLPHPKTRQGLVLELDCANYQGGPTLLDTSGSGRVASLLGTDFRPTAGGAMLFDGTNNDHISIPAPSPLVGTSLFTFTCWVNTTSITGLLGGSNRAAWLFGGGTGFGTGQPEFGILSASGSSLTPNILTFGRGGGATTGACNISVAGIVFNNRWHFMSLVRDGVASQRVYVDGTAIGTGTVSNSFVDGVTAFGALPGNSSYGGRLNGLIGEICIYSRPLSDAEVWQNYMATRRRFGV